MSKTIATLDVGTHYNITEWAKETEDPAHDQTLILVPSIFRMLHLSLVKLTIV